MSYFALLDDAVSGQAKLYQNHTESRFFTAHGLEQLDKVLQEGWQKGRCALLCADYAFGLPLLNLPVQERGFLAVHWFECCENVCAQTWLQSFSDGLSAPAGISTPVSDTEHAEYLAAIDEIHEAIRRGDTYQINYTTRLHFQTYGHPAALYRRLRQPVPYAALARLPDPEDSETWTLCFSPELFLKIGSDGLVTTEPMKGTAPVLNDGLDEARARALQNDPKNRAENIMIVDLLRNDLGKIAQTGQVRVPEPFKVARFGSVWQMTSAVEAQAKPHTRAADIFRAAFPCGSITGAPKRMSMDIIEKLEKSPRGLYTGSIGFLNPCSSGLGFEGVLNVVIRTLVLRPSEKTTDCAPKPQSEQTGIPTILPHHPKPSVNPNLFSDGLYRAEYGVGSGIVIDSDAQAEWEECGWKARFLTRLRPEFGIFETILAEQNHCALLSRHLGRLKTSAHALNLVLPPDALQQIEAYLTALPPEARRVKILLDSDGLSFSNAPLQALEGRQSVLIAPEILPSRDYLRRFKTTRREIYDAAWQQAAAQGAFDSLFFNSDGLLLEGGRSNVFVKTDGKWHTPGLDCDILNGVMRQAVLDHPQRYLGTEHVSECAITRDMLARAQSICLSNALRGVFEVTVK